MNKVLPTKILIDGIDRLGKSTLIKNILDQYGYHLVIHYDKPKLLSYYNDKSSNKNTALLNYQKETNKRMFDLMKTDVPIIFDRTHLGEMVYAPIYRGYNGDYVYQYEMEAMEYRMFTHKEAFRLVLLTTSNFNMLEDDGLSFDFNKKEEEQKLFIKAFERSSIVNKVIIDVHDGKGGYKPQSQVLAEAMGLDSFLKKS